MPKQKSTETIVKMKRVKKEITLNELNSLPSPLSFSIETDLNFSMSSSQYLGSVARNSSSNTSLFHFDKDLILEPNEVVNLHSFLPIICSLQMSYNLDAKIFVNSDLYGPGTFIVNTSNRVLCFQKSFSYQFAILNCTKLSDKKNDDCNFLNLAFLIKGWKDQCFPIRDDDLKLVYSVIENLGGYVTPCLNKKALFLYNSYFQQEYTNSLPNFDMHSKLDFSLEDFAKPTEEFKFCYERVKLCLHHDQIIAATIPKQAFHNVEKIILVLLAMSKEKIHVMVDKKNTNLANNLIFNLQAAGQNPSQALKYFEQPSQSLRSVCDFSRKFRIMVKPSGTQPKELAAILKIFTMHFFTLINAVPFTFNSRPAAENQLDDGTKAIRILYNGSDRDWRKHWETYLKSGPCLILTFTDNMHYNFPFEQALLLVRKIVKKARLQSNIIWTRNIAHCSENIEEEFVFNELENTILENENLKLDFNTNEFKFI